MNTISDIAILDSGWINQLSLLSRNTVLRNVDSGEMSVVDDTHRSMQIASSEFMVSCKNITKLIPSSQLRERIVSLQKTGDILDTSSLYDKLDSFMINGDKAQDAFNTARKWWSDKGAKNKDIDIGGMGVCLPSSELKSLSADCLEMLLKEFPTRD